MTGFRHWLLSAVMVACAIASCVVEETDRDRFDDDDNDATGGQQALGGHQGGFGLEGTGGSTTTSTTTSTTSNTGGGGNSCPDTDYEPNDTEPNATDLGTINDNDNNGSYVDARLSGDDVDWFKFYGTDDFGYQVGPHAEITSNGQARACAFFECVGLSVTCPQGTTEETSPQGRPGCCSLSPFDVTIDCTGASDDAMVYLRVDKPAAFKCVDYTLSYHY